MKQLIRKFIPKAVINQYHKTLAVLANIIYGRPSEKMIVIGVTGTNGKSSTVVLIAKILESAGHKVGAASTVYFKVAEKEWLNDKKMTMLGRMALQKLLKQMVLAGCRYAIIETSSQGIEQFRHLGVHYDVAVFTNLTPEHIEAHGGFDNYKKAKLKLFKHLEKLPAKILLSKKIRKTIIVNGDDKSAKEFLDFEADSKLVFGIENNLAIRQFNNLTAKEIVYSSDGITFEVNNVEFNLKLFGRFNIYNALAAIAVAQSQDIDWEVCRHALEKISGVPGRMEFIDEDQPFKVLVDYAYEPESLKQVFAAIKCHGLVGEGKKIIHLLGGCGGGRDKARQPIMGELSAKNADIAIVANEDPYDDDPQEIIEAVAAGAVKAGKIAGQNLFKVIDRTEAIAKAFTLAQEGDLVLLTGKGAEQVIAVANGHKIPWDERVKTREVLNKMGWGK